MRRAAGMPGTGSAVKRSTERQPAGSRASSRACSRRQGSLPCERSVLAIPGEAEEGVDEQEQEGEDEVEDADRRAEETEAGRQCS